MANCSICFEEMDNDIVTNDTCDCNVFFHKPCLDSCRKHNILCPICRIKTNVYQSRGNINRPPNIFNQMMEMGVPLFIMVLIFISHSLLIIFVGCIIFVITPIYWLYVLILRYYKIILKILMGYSLL